MGEAFLDYAKELYRNGKVNEAYNMALLVSRNDAFCPNVHQLVAIYGVLIHRRSAVNRSRIDCYRVLGVPSSASDEQIAHRFATLKKIIAPARNTSPSASRSSTAAAAEAANSLLNFAFETLSDERSRREFDSRRKLSQLKKPTDQNAGKEKKESLILPPPPPQWKEAPVRRIRVVYGTKKSYRCDPIGSSLSGHHRRRMQSGM